MIGRADNANRLGGTRIHHGQGTNCQSKLKSGAALPPEPKRQISQTRQCELGRVISHCRKNPLLKSLILFADGDLKENPKERIGNNKAVRMTPARIATLN